MTHNQRLHVLNTALDALAAGATPEQVFQALRDDARVPEKRAVARDVTLGLYALFTCQKGEA